MVEAAATRRRLPNRRPHDTEVMERDGVRAHVGVGFDPETMRPVELFVSTNRLGTAIEDLMQDVAVIVSVALQHGVTAEAMSLSIARRRKWPERLKPRDLDPKHGARREPDEPASWAGALLDHVAKLERELQESGDGGY